MTAPRPWRPLGALLLLAALGGCSLFGGDDEREQIPGNRISVLQLQQQLAPSAELEAMTVALPAPRRNESWPQSGGGANHNPGHLELPASLARVWATDIGEGSSCEVRLTAQPVATGGRAFTLDAGGTASAVDLATGDLLWQVRVTPADESERAPSGGLAVADGRLFVITGYRDVLALDIENGGQIWSRRLQSPTRGAPSAEGGRLFVPTIENELIALSQADGSVLWSHAGGAEAETLVGASSPAAEGEVVVAAYSSGELYALRAENGRELWSDDLSIVRRAGSPWALADIRAEPVIVGDRVLAGSLAGRTVAIERRAGARLWQVESGSLATPAVAGEWVFLVTSADELVAVRLETGEIRWVSQLQQYEDAADREDPVFWTGPLVGGGRIVLGNSRGQLVSVSAESGEQVGLDEAGAPITVTPIIVEGGLLVLTDWGTLEFWR